MHFVTHLLIYISLILLSACSSVPKHQQTIEKGSVPLFWRAEGKLGIRSAGSARSANFIWENLDKDYHIQLFGPFGQGRVHIEKRDKLVELRRNEITRNATSASQLLEQETGIVMPVHWLSSWVLGQPSKDIDVENLILDKDNRVSRFKQGEWQVNYLRYGMNQQQYLPTKLILTHENYTLTVIIKSWKI